MPLPAVHSYAAECIATQIWSCQFSFIPCQQSPDLVDLACPCSGSIVNVVMMLQYALTRAQRTSSLNTDDSWMYEDGHDEIVFSVDQPCQLLGVGLCGTEGAYTAELELLEVLYLLSTSS